jgi:bacillolysin
MRLLSKKTLFVLILVALTLIIMIIPTTAAEKGQNPAGFRALNGQAARNFQVPGDMKLVAQEGLARYGLSADRYRQFVGEAEVLGGQLTVYRDEAGTAVAVLGSHYPDLAAQNTVKLSAGQAKSLAVSQHNQGSEWFTTLLIDPGNGRYFYVVENRGIDSRWFTWVDAETGAILNSYDGLTTGTGIGVLGDTKDLTGLTTYVSGTYRLATPNGRITTYDARNRTKLPGTLATDSNDIWNLLGRTSPGQPALVDAHYYAFVTDNYYLNTHGFNWLTYYPQGMVSSAHLKKNYSNAYWNGSQMAYGDGDGVTFIEMSGDLDVVAHELSHGVTEATSDLIYQYESGALNEAFSDIMGTSVEYFYGTGNWTIGEDIMPTDDGIRDMADPGSDGDPSDYDERYTGTADSGGVHTNSGIANHWYYLLVEGGQNADPIYASGTDVVGIGLANAEEITFLGFTGLPANATFCTARAATIAVAGSYSANVADAWDEVGVDVALCGN